VAVAVPADDSDTIAFTNPAADQKRCNSLHLISKRRPAPRSIAEKNELAIRIYAFTAREGAAQRVIVRRVLSENFERFFHLHPQLREYSPRSVTDTGGVLAWKRDFKLRHRVGACLLTRRH
jgi:hypothetical protein